MLVLECLSISRSEFACKCMHQYYFSCIPINQFLWRSPLFKNVCIFMNYFSSVVQYVLVGRQSVNCPSNTPF